MFSGLNSVPAPALWAFFEIFLFYFSFIGSISDKIEDLQQRSYAWEWDPIRRVLLLHHTAPPYFV